VVEPREIMHPLDGRAASPQSFREQLVRLAERLGVRRFRPAGPLRLVKGPRDERLRGEERLEIHDAQEAPPSHRTRHGSQQEKGVGAR